jgi:transposase
VRELIESPNGQIEVEFLPAYTPELNPAEYIWGHLKQHELANLCVKNFAELSPFARNRLRSMQRRPRLITAFWTQAELAF